MVLDQRVPRQRGHPWRYIFLDFLRARCPCIHRLAERMFEIRMDVTLICAVFIVTLAVFLVPLRNHYHCIPEWLPFHIPGFAICHFDEAAVNEQFARKLSSGKEPEEYVSVIEGTLSIKIKVIRDEQSPVMLEFMSDSLSNPELVQVASKHIQSPMAAVNNIKTKLDQLNQIERTNYYRPLSYWYYDKDEIVGELIKYSNGETFDHEDDKRQGIITIIAHRQITLIEMQFEIIRSPEKAISIKFLGDGRVLQVAFPDLYREINMLNAQAVDNFERMSAGLPYELRQHLYAEGYIFTPPAVSEDPDKKIFSVDLAWLAEKLFIKEVRSWKTDATAGNLRLRSKGFYSEDAAASWIDQVIMMLMDDYFISEGFIHAVLRLSTQEATLRNKLLFDVGYELIYAMQAKEDQYSLSKLIAAIHRAKHSDDDPLTHINIRMSIESILKEILSEDEQMNYQMWKEEGDHQNDVIQQRHAEIKQRLQTNDGDSKVILIADDKFEFAFNNVKVNGLFPFIERLGLKIERKDTPDSFDHVIVIRNGDSEWEWIENGKSTAIYADADYLYMELWQQRKQDPLVTALTLSGKSRLHIAYIHRWASPDVELKLRTKGYDNRSGVCWMCSLMIMLRDEYFINDFVESVYQLMRIAEIEADRALLDFACHLIDAMKSDADEFHLNNLVDAIQSAWIIHELNPKQVRIKHFAGAEASEPGGSTALASLAVNTLIEQILERVGKDYALPTDDHYLTTLMSD